MLENNSLDAQALAQIVRTSPYFDEQWYLEQYPEIEYHEDGNPDAAYHYANYGYKEQRLPSVLFDGNKYSQYHNLKDINPLLHYIAQGCPGDYRAHNLEQGLLVKLNEGGNLTNSQKALLLEGGYKTTTNKDLDLAATPATLSEKFYFLRAFHLNLWDKHTPLFDLRTLSSTLQNNYGFSQEQAPSPVALFDNAAALTQEQWDKLPNAFYFLFNGLTATTISVSDKRKVKLSEVHTVLENVQKQCQSNLSERLTAQAQAKFVIGCFALTKADQEPSLEFNVLCTNGQASTILVSGANRALNLYDRDFNLLGCSLANDSQGARPALEQVEKPKCYEQMLELANKLAANVPCLAVRFKVFKDRFFCQEVRPDLYNGNFLLTNDFDLRLGVAFNINYLFKS